MTRFIAISFITILLLACGGKKPILVTQDTAELRNITETVSAGGKIQPEFEVKISSDVSGEIVELFVKEGDSVVKGQLMLEINPDILQSAAEAANAGFNNAKANLAAAKARLEQSRSQLLRAEADFNRNKNLFDKKAISEAEFIGFKTSFEVAKADLEAANEAVKGAEFTVENARASSSQAQKNLARTKIFAPSGGTISKLVVEKGERVVGTAQMSGTELLRIAHLTDMQVVVDVNENDIVRINLNDTALIDVDAYPNRKFKGVVTQIANSPKTASNNALTTDEVTNFQVKIRILRDSYSDLIQSGSRHKSPFRPGMSATVDIQTKTEKNVLSVPIQSVTSRQDTTVKDSKNEVYKEYVFLIDNNKVVQKEVKIGIQDNKHIAIKEGLNKGDKIVSGPYTAISKTLENGKEILVVTEKELFSPNAK